MSVTTRSMDKSGVMAAIIGSFSCAACFPAGASIGGDWSWISELVGKPVRAHPHSDFCLAVPVANLVGGFTHRAWYRTATDTVGRVVALIGAFGLTHGFLPASIARRVFYAGLTVMVWLRLATWRALPGVATSRAVLVGRPSRPNLATRALRSQRSWRARASLLQPPLLLSENQP